MLLVVIIFVCHVVLLLCRWSLSKGPIVHVSGLFRANTSRYLLILLHIRIFKAFLAYFNTHKTITFNYVKFIIATNQQTVAPAMHKFFLIYCNQFDTYAVLRFVCTTEAIRFLHSAANKKKHYSCCSVNTCCLLHLVFY